MATLESTTYCLPQADVTATCIINVQGVAFRVLCTIPVAALAALADADNRADWAMTDVAALASGLIGQTVTLP